MTTVAKRAKPSAMTGLLRLLPPLRLFKRSSLQLRQSFGAVWLLALPLTAFADFDACVKSVPLDDDVLASLPPSSDADNAREILGVRGFRNELVSLECWRGGGRAGDFEQSGFVTVYLPAVSVGDICVADTENYRYSSGQWVRELRSGPRIGVTLHPPDACDKIRVDQLVDVYELIETNSLESLLRAEPEIYRQYQAAEVHARGRTSLTAVSVERYEWRTFFVLWYRLDSCISIMLYVTGGKEGHSYARGAEVWC